MVPQMNWEDGADRLCIVVKSAGVNSMNMHGQEKRKWNALSNG